jgi:LysR family hydrogen peroxide-inducible transcriptional activator
MTLTELRYLAALAETRHFGRAAEKCHVSQPTLSMGIKSLEDKLGLQLCERRRQETLLTQAGEAIAAEAALVLARVRGIRDMALASRDEFQAPLRLGVIYTVAPALLPYLVRTASASSSRLKLHLRENYTDELLASLRAGTLDAIVLSPPFHDEGLDIHPLYSRTLCRCDAECASVDADEDVLRQRRSREKRAAADCGQLLRDQVLDVCPACASSVSMAIRKVSRSWKAVRYRRSGRWWRAAPG